MHNNQTRFLPKGRVDCFEAAVKTIASDFAPIRRDKQIMAEVGCNCRNDPRDAKSPRPIPCIVVPMPSRLHRESDEEAELGTILEKRSDASASMLGATPSLSDASAKSDAARQPPSSRHPKCSGTNSSTDTALTLFISELSDSCRVLPESYSFFQNLLVRCPRYWLKQY